MVEQASECLEEIVVTLIAHSEYMLHVVFLVVDAAALFGSLHDWTLQCDVKLCFSCVDTILTFLTAAGCIFSPACLCLPCSFISFTQMNGNTGDVIKTPNVYLSV